MAEQYSTVAGEYAAAFGTIRLAKNVFWWLVGICLLVQLVGFILVDFVGVVDGQFARPAGQEDVSSALTWYQVLGWALPATKFFAFTGTILLALTLLTAVKISLVDRIGGVAGFISAFFWSLVLLVVITPWQQVFLNSFASGATFNLGDIEHFGSEVRAKWGAENISTWAVILYYARFIGGPVVALLIWLLTQAKFSRGWRRVVQSTTVSAPPLAPAQP